MPKLQLCVTVSKEIARTEWQGRIVAQPVPRVLRNDAGALYELLAGLDHSKERFRDHRRTISSLCRLLRPLRRAAQTIETDTEDKVVGEIEISEEALRFIGKLFSDPPEGINMAAISVDTALLVEDAVDALKKAEAPDGAQTSVRAAAEA